MNLTCLLPLAQTPAPQPGGSGMMIGWVILMIAVFYFLIMRPQQRREKERRAMLDQVKSGDRIAFSGGILGLVTNVKDKTLTVRIADGVKIEVARHAVAQVLDKGEDVTEDAAQKA